MKPIWNNFDLKFILYYDVCTSCTLSCSGLGCQFVVLWIWQRRRTIAVVNSPSNIGFPCVTPILVTASM